MTEREGPIYTKYFAQFSLVMWCKDELFIRDSFKKQQVQWNLKDVMDSAEELKQIYETLRELEVKKESRLDVVIGDCLSVSVHHPTPLAIIKGRNGTLQTDSYAWWVLMETCEELRQNFGAYVERSRLCEEFMLIIYTGILEEMVRTISTEKCYGCKVDHPSQIQHDVCLMMDYKEKVELCLPEAIERVDHLQATQLWEQGISLLSPRPEWEEISKLMSTDYRLFWLHSKLREIEKRLFVKKQL